jgi:hypothetical protein
VFSAVKGEADKNVHTTSRRRVTVDAEQRLSNVCRDAFLFPDTPVAKLLKVVPFSPPWRASLCTPLERGWVKPCDIETARFSVASCDASAVVPRRWLKPVREATLKRPVTGCAFLFTPAAAGCKERPAGSGPQQAECRRGAKIAA